MRAGRLWVVVRENIRGRKWCSSSHTISRQTSKLGEGYSALRDIEISTGWSIEAVPKAAALPRSTWSEAVYVMLAMIIMYLLWASKQVEPFNKTRKPLRITARVKLRCLSLCAWAWAADQNAAKQRAPSPGPGPTTSKPPTAGWRGKLTAAMSGFFATVQAKFGPI
jgi:hypothetical protein